jgi:hypothetical protein
MTEQEKQAYNLGAALALLEAESLEKEASVLRAGLSGLKWLAGFSGGTASRTLGGATGFGLFGAYKAERNEDGSLNYGNIAKGFAGGFAGGLAFSGAMAGAGRAGKLLNMNKAKANAKFLQGKSKEMKGFKDAITKQQDAIAAAKNVSPVQRATMREGLKDSKAAYKTFLKDNNISNLDRLRYTVATGKGSAIGMATGLGLGLQVATPIEEYAQSTMTVPYQSNPFNTAYYK